MKETKDSKAFKELFDALKERYGHINMIGYVVYYDDVPKFNTQGFNLLYNTTRLCDLLKDELI